MTTATASFGNIPSGSFLGTPNARESRNRLMEFLDVERTISGVTDTFSTAGEWYEALKQNFNKQVAELFKGREGNVDQMFAQTDASSLNMLSDEGDKALHGLTKLVWGNDGAGNSLIQNLQSAARKLQSELTLANPSLDRDSLAKAYTDALNDLQTHLSPPEGSLLSRTLKELAYDAANPMASQNRARQVQALLNEAKNSRAFVSSRLAANLLDGVSDKEAFLNYLKRTLRLSDDVISQLRNSDLSPQELARITRNFDFAEMLGTDWNRGPFRIFSMGFQRIMNIIPGLNWVTRPVFGFLNSFETDLMRQGNIDIGRAIIQSGEGIQNGTLSFGRAFRHLFVQNGNQMLAELGELFLRNGFTNALKAWGGRALGIVGMLAAVTGITKINGPIGDIATFITDFSLGDGTTEAAESGNIGKMVGAILKNIGLGAATALLTGPIAGLIATIPALAAAGPFIPLVIASVVCFALVNKGWSFLYGLLNNSHAAHSNTPGAPVPLNPSVVPPDINALFNQANALTGGGNPSSSTPVP